MKRICSFTLALILFLLVVTPCFAAQNDTPAVTPRYTYIQANSVSFTINESSGVASSSTFCYTYGDYEVQITLKLQRYNNSKWNTVKTWTTSGMRDASLSKTWAVPSGYTYRAYATFNIYDDNGNLIETATNSKSAYFPKN